MSKDKRNQESDDKKRHKESRKEKPSFQELAEHADRLLYESALKLESFDSTNEKFPDKVAKLREVMINLQDIFQILESKVTQQ